MSPPRRVVILVTSATAPLHENHPTGLFITEALHPFQVFTEAGFEVDLVSEKQSYTEDWLSTTKDFLNGKHKEEYDDRNSAFRKKLDNMPDPKTIDGNRYGIFFASAGHAALIDFPHANDLHKIASDVWNSGGVAPSVYVPVSF